MVKEKIILDDFVIFPMLNKVVFQGNEVRIEPKIMQVLCFLIEHPNKALSREEIAQHIAPNSVTGLEVVTRAIFEIRKVLKDSAKSPKYIETIPRKGYCFIGKEPVPLENEIGGILQQNVDKKKAKDKTKISARIFVFSAFVATSFIFLFVNVFKEIGVTNDATNLSDTQPIKQFQSQLLTNSNVNAKSLALSLTGKKALFVTADKNSPHKQLVLLDIPTRNREIVVESEDRFVSPVWAEQSNSFYYGVCNNSTCSVKQNFLYEDKEIVLLEISSPIFDFHVSKTNQMIAISTIGESGRIVSLYDFNGDLKVDSIATSTEYKLGKPVFSKEGDSLYTVGHLARKAKQLFRYDLEKSSLVEIPHDFEFIFDVVNKNNNKLWVAARKEGQSAIWAYDTETGTFSKEISGQLGEFQTELSASNDGRLLLYRSLKRDIDILTAGKLDTLNHAKINENLIDMNGVYSNLLGKLFFTSNRTGSHEVWATNVEHLEKITNLNANLIERPIFSDNEDKLAFITSIANNSYLSVINISTKEVLSKFEVPQQSFALSWSAKEEHIYISAFKSGQYSIYEVDLNNGNLRQRNINAGLIAHQKVNGDFYFANLLTGALMLEKQNGEVTEVYTLPQGLKPLMPHQARIIDDKLFYVADNGETKKLVSVDLGSQNETVHLDLPIESYVTQIGVSSEPQTDVNQPFVIYDKLVNDAAQLILVEEVE